MAGDHSNPLAHPEVKQAGTGRYIAAFVTTVVLMLVALVVTQHQAGQAPLPYPQFAGAVGGLALLTLVSQAALFLGLDISRAQIWKSVSLVLTVPLFILSIGLTVWMFQSLAERTMLMPMDAPAASQPTLLQ